LSILGVDELEGAANFDLSDRLVGPFLSLLLLDLELLILEVDVNANASGDEEGQGNHVPIWSAAAAADFSRVRERRGGWLRG